MKISHKHKFSGKVKPSNFACSPCNQRGCELRKPEVSAQ